MNLVDKLLKADIKTADELDTGIFKSKKLAKILGVEDAVEVRIREIKSRRVNDIMAYQMDKNGHVDFAKSYDAKLMMCVEGVIEPDLRNKELQNHFECGSAKDLAEKLFGFEINAMSDAISVLSGVVLPDGEDEEEEVKN